MANTEVKTWESLSFNELGAFKDTKIKELDAYFKSHTKDGQISMDATELDIVRMKNTEITEATKRWEQLREASDIFKQTVAAHDKINTVDRQTPFIVSDGKGGFQQAGAVKTLGQMFVESNAYKSMRGLHDGQPNYQVALAEGLDMPAMKTLMTTSAGFAPANDRTTRLVEFAIRRPMVGDLIPTDATTLTSIKYMEETTWGTATTNANPAAAVAEGDAKPEAEMVWEEKDVPVQKIAVYIPVTTEQLDDVPGIQGVINNRLSMMLQLKEEDYLLNGTGTPPQITGFLVKTGVQTQAAAGDTNIDTLYKAMTKVRTVGFAEPTAVVAHPNNWTPIRLAKTLDGLYIWGHPSDPGPERIFGKSVVVTTAMTAGTALTGDFQLYSHISRRQGITIIVGTIGNQLIENKKTIVAEMRESLEIYRAAAFCKATGLSS
jgi:HK97 family phage major capsid protein